VLLGVLALIPVIGLIGLAAAPGGIGGQVSKTWDQLTSPARRLPRTRPTG
jgi:hypothetical protein